MAKRKKEAGGPDEGPALPAGGQDHYVLTLYVVGMAQNSVKAIENIRQICEEHLKYRYELEVVDISTRPALAVQEQIVAAPTLIKRLPPPLRRLIGTMMDDEKVLVSLDIRRRMRA